MLTIVSYIGLLIGAVVFTLSIYLGLLKVVKFISLTGISLEKTEYAKIFIPSA